LLTVVLDRHGALRLAMTKILMLEERLV
jgi:hypothetical protein